MRLLLAIAVLLVLALMTGCGETVRGPGSKNPYREVSFDAGDNTTIVAHYYPSDADKGLVMIHGAAKSKSSYEDYAKELQDRYKVIVPDLRGHGDSEGEYKDLENHDFYDMQKDVNASVAFLRTEGVAKEDVSLVGASVGANLALMYAEDNPVDKLLLLSPGTRIRGVDISRLSYEQPLLVQVGHYDAFSSIAVEELELNLPEARVMEYDSSAHGTDLLNHDLSAEEEFLFYLS
ncbi:MAG: alpha/beta hydrolase [Candidatus Woesearchaeota archaeon]